MIIWLANNNKEAIKPIMYTIYKKVLHDRITNIISPSASYGNAIIKYFDNVPYIYASCGKFSMEARADYLVNNSIRKMLKLFNIDAYWNTSFLKSNGDYLQMNAKLVQHKWLGTTGRWSVYTLNDLPIYDIVDGRVDRLLLLLIIDPLAFISKMRQHIDGASVQVQQFFGMMETNINDMMQRYLVKYFLVKQLELEMVNDVILLVFGYWLRLEIWEIEKN